nr:hypothetical protein [Tanacetum cinerariifolium]
MGSAPTVRLRVFYSLCRVSNKFTWCKNGTLKYPNSHLFGPDKIHPNFCINKMAPSVGPNTRITLKRMSAMANTTPIVTTVIKPTTNPRDVDATPRVNIQDFCEEYYEDILPIIMDKVCRDKRKEVYA